MGNPTELFISPSTPTEFDYVWLMSLLKDYAAPRDVLTRLLAHGVLIRVKKGLYVLGAQYRQRPICLELLANLIYGPSYVSREYALSYYGLIPEGVNEITSMTNKRHKHFKTPVGRFDYAYLNEARYSIGIERVSFVGEVKAFMAIPEKALADYIYVRKENITKPAELLQVLLEDYRMDETNLSDLNLQDMEKIALCYRNRTISLLSNVIRALR